MGQGKRGQIYFPRDAPENKSVPFSPLFSVPSILRDAIVRSFEGPLIAE